MDKEISIKHTKKGKIISIISNKNNKGKPPKLNSNIIKFLKAYIAEKKLMK